MSKAPDPAEIEKMRKAVADHDSNLAAEAMKVARDTVAPARALLDSDELKAVLKMASEAAVALSRFAQLHSILQNMAQCAELLPGFVQRAEDQAVAEKMAETRTS